jgi:hypothetical protein
LLSLRGPLPVGIGGVGFPHRVPSPDSVKHHVSGGFPLRGRHLRPNVITQIHWTTSFPGVTVIGGTQSARLLRPPKPHQSRRTCVRSHRRKVQTAPWWRIRVKLSNDRTRGADARDSRTRPDERFFWRRMLGPRLSPGYNLGSCPLTRTTIRSLRLDGPAPRQYAAIAWYPCYREQVIRAFEDRGTEDIFSGRKMIPCHSEPSQTSVVPEGMIEA